MSLSRYQPLGKLEARAVSVHIKTTKKQYLTNIKLHAKIDKNGKYEMTNRQKTNYSAREAAHILGVSVRTAQLWVEEGRLQAWKTPGGHRRILVTSVDRLLAQQMAMAGQTHTELSILILDSDPLRSEALGLDLQSALPDCRIDVAQDAVSATLRIGGDNPDILVVDFASLPVNSLLELLTHPQVHHQSRLVIAISEDADAASRIRPVIPANTTLLFRQSPPRELIRLVDVFRRGCRHREQLA